MCPNCRAFVSSADTVCPYCETPLGPKMAIRETRTPTSGFIGGLIPHARFTTSMILLLNLLLFVASMLDEQGRLLMAASSNGQFVFGFKQWWRLITAGFFHGGIFHILMNSWALFDLGSQVEDVYGSDRLIVFYFLTTIAGFLLSAAIGHTAVGSSAGIFGLLGVMIGLGRSARSTLGDHIAGFYTRWVIFGLVMSFLPGIDMAAHLGGLAAGFVLAYTTGLPSRFQTPGEAIWRWASYGCVLLTAVAFFQMFRLYLRISY